MESNLPISIEEYRQNLKGYVKGLLKHYGGGSDAVSLNEIGRISGNVSIPGKLSYWASGRITKPVNSYEFLEPLDPRNTELDSDGNPIIRASWLTIKNELEGRNLSEYRDLTKSELLALLADRDAALKAQGTAVTV